MNQPFRADEPNWSQSATSQIRPVNAKAEGIDIKPMFADLFADQRCLIPATGFQEWRIGGGAKHPRFFGPRSDGVFGFAGIWNTHPGVPHPEPFSLILHPAQVLDQADRPGRVVLSGNQNIEHAGGVLLLDAIIQ